MQWYEAETLIRYQYYAHRDQWEGVRFLANTVINMHAKSKVSLRETLPFYWEEYSQEDKAALPTKEDAERLHKKAQYYIKQHYNG